MRIICLSLLVSLLSLSSAYGQRDSFRINDPAETQVHPSQASGQATFADPPFVVARRTVQIPQPQAVVVENQRDWSLVDTTSFNATQPISKVLINPDQFWTRKQRPVIDYRQHNLFGDPNCACDEWAGFCRCCGLKSSPGHLGMKWLSSGDPCECVDNCCPTKRNRCK